MRIRNFESLKSGLRIGRVQAGNYAVIETDGSIRFFGTASVWEDIQSSLIGQRLNSTAGTVDYNYTENAIAFSPNGDIATEADLVRFSYQYPHKAKADGELKLHMHWEQVDGTDREFTVAYRIQSNFAIKTTDWTEVVVSTNTNNASTYPGSGTWNQITRLTTINMSGSTISSPIQFKMTRTDAEIGALNITFVDAHYEIDAGGSRQEYIK